MPTGGRAAAGSRAERGRRRARQGLPHQRREALQVRAARQAAHPFQAECRGDRGVSLVSSPRAGAGPPAADGGARGMAAASLASHKGPPHAAGPDHQDPGGGSAIRNTVPVIPFTLARRGRKSAGKCAVCGGPGRGEGAGRPPACGGAGHPILTACAVWAMQLYRRPPPRGPFVYRLGHLVFNQGRGVRLP